MSRAVFRRKALLLLPLMQVALALLGERRKALTVERASLDSRATQLRSLTKKPMNRKERRFLDRKIKQISKHNPPRNDDQEPPSSSV